MWYKPNFENGWDFLPIPKSLTHLLPSSPTWALGAFLRQREICRANSEGTLSLENRVREVLTSASAVLTRLEAELQIIYSAWRPGGLREKRQGHKQRENLKCGQDVEEQMKTVARGSTLLEIQWKPLLSQGVRVYIFLLFLEFYFFLVVFHFCCCHLYLLNLFCFCIFSWSIVDLQCCVSFRNTAKWISYTFTLYPLFFLDYFPI